MPFRFTNALDPSLPGAGTVDGASALKSLLTGKCHGLRCVLSRAFVAIVVMPGVATAQEAETSPPAAVTDQAVPAPAEDSKDGAPGPQSGLSVGLAEQAAKDGGATLLPDGRVKMQFQNQSWLAALQWLATASELNLDWQSLPADQVNLTTQQAYTLEEARDLFNMQLMARGFTLIKHGELLSVVPLASLNPALLPRVTPQELKDRTPHEFVRVTFPLDWLIAEQAAKDAQPLLSGFGKALPLQSTNQLEVFDAVINVRSVQALLAAEQSVQGKERLIGKFPLQHAKAEDVVQKLRELLGVSSRPRTRGPQVYEELRLDLEKTRVKAEAIQKLGQDARQLLEPESEVHFAIDETMNLILCHAAPDKLELVRQAIQTLDRPSEQPFKALQSVQNVKLYEVPGGDVDAVRDLLEQLKSEGVLSAETWFDIEAERGLLIASATPAEHVAIVSFVQRYLPAARSAQVLPLRKLEPNYAAQALRLMVLPSAGRFGTPPRIEVDEANQRLLAWGTESELAAMQDFLIQLGEPDMRSGTQGLALELSPQEWLQIREAFQAKWQTQSKVPLHVQPDSPSETSTERVSATVAHNDSGSDSQPVRRALFAEVVPTGASNRVPSKRNSELEPRALSDASAESLPVTAASTTSQEPARLLITEGEGGQVILRSNDPAALGAAETLVKELLPSKPDYAVFPLKHALAYSVAYKIEEVLGISDEEDRTRRGTPANTLAPAQRIRLVTDYQTNTLLVQSATTNQLQQVKQLVELYDQPRTTDDELARQSKVIVIKNGKAQQIAESLKDVYRDLLSANDKAFDARQIGTGDPGLRVGYAYSVRKEPQYQGMLSIGIDEQQNAVIVSAPGFLIAEVCQLVEQLDAAGGERHVVVTAFQGVEGDSLRHLLGGVIGKPIPKATITRLGRANNPR